MKINLTKKQYEALVRAVYLGNWMANAYRDGSKDEQHLKEFEGISDYVFSLAPLFGFSENLEHELEYDEVWMKDHDGLSELSVIHDQYDEDSFWDELTERLGGRDFDKKYSKEEIGNMDDETFHSKRYECLDVWDDEFCENGIDRLGIVMK